MEIVHFLFFISTLWYINASKRISSQRCKVKERISKEFNSEDKPAKYLEPKIVSKKRNKKMGEQNEKSDKVVELEDINDKHIMSLHNVNHLGATTRISLETDKSTENVLEKQNYESSIIVRKRKIKNCDNMTKGYGCSQSAVDCVPKLGAADANKLGTTSKKIVTSVHCFIFFPKASLFFNDAFIISIVQCCPPRGYV